MSEVKLKFPILLNAGPIKTDVSPIFSRGPYDVFVGTIAEDRLPQYVIINREHGVVEFTSEVTAVINDWLNFFVKDQLSDDKSGGQLNLGLAN